MQGAADKKPNKMANMNKADRTPARLLMKLVGLATVLASAGGARLEAMAVGVRPPHGAAD
jgi:hypothetical protein